MTILVFDVPASEGGALVVLRDFFQHVLLLPNDHDKWVFVVSTDSLIVPAGKKNVEVLRFPGVKKSWFNRLVFEFFVAPRLIRQRGTDVVFSLQNIAILRTKVPQVVYVHQSIPYSTRRFSYWMKEERTLAFLGDLFRPLIGWSVKRAKSVVVQTKWLSVAIAKAHSIASEKILVVPQSVEFVRPQGIVRRKLGHFFYPATPFKYKAIEEVVEAVVLLVKRGFRPTVVLTIDGNENSYAKKLHRRILDCDLLVYFHLLGRIPRERVMEYYQESVLVFSSRLESFGLPLLEARLLGVPVIATDQPFSKEILNGYRQAVFVKQNSPGNLADAMVPFFESGSLNATSKIPMSSIAEKVYSSGWSDVVSLIRKASVR